MTYTNAAPGSSGGTATFIRSWQDAELNAAAWMRRWGYSDAAARPGGPDGGIDIWSTGSLAQVKYETSHVGLPVMQQLFGARGTSFNKQLIFFAASGYTKQAIAYANQHDIALFLYNPYGEMSALNEQARKVSTRREASTKRAAQETPAAKRIGPTSPLPSTRLRRNWRLLVGLLFLFLPVSHAANGAITNPVSAALDVVVLGGTGATLIRWWNLRRKEPNPAAFPDHLGPSGSVLAPGLFGVIFTLFAVLGIIEGISTGEFEPDLVEAIFGLGALGLACLALSTLLYGRHRKKVSSRPPRT